MKGALPAGLVLRIEKDAGAIPWLLDDPGRRNPIVPAAPLVIRKETNQSSAGRNDRKHDPEEAERSASQARWSSETIDDSVTRQQASQGLSGESPKENEITHRNEEPHAAEGRQRRSGKAPERPPDHVRRYIGEPQKQAGNEAEVDETGEKTIRRPSENHRARRGVCRSAVSLQDFVAPEFDLRRPFRLRMRTRGSQSRIGSPRNGDFARIDETSRPTPAFAPRFPKASVGRHARLCEPPFDSRTNGGVTGPFAALFRASGVERRLGGITEYRKLAGFGVAPPELLSALLSSPFDALANVVAPVDYVRGRGGATALRTHTQGRVELGLAPPANHSVTSERTPRTRPAPRREAASPRSSR